MTSPTRTHSAPPTRTLPAPPTRTLPARVPDGWWTSHPRYRNYVLFAGTGLVLALDVLILLRGVTALGAGAGEWAAYQATLSTPIGIGLGIALLIATTFFSVRFLRLGVKVGTANIGPISGPPAPVVFVAHFAGLAALTGLVLLVVSGVIL